MSSTWRSTWRRGPSKYSAPPKNLGPNVLRWITGVACAAWMVAAAGCSDAPPAVMDATTTDTGAPTDGGATDGMGIDAGVACALTTDRRTETAGGLRVVHHDGQSFVSWRDRAEGAAGEAYRYRLYRSSAPIASDADLGAAELIASGILNHSGQLFGVAFRPPQRLDEELAMAVDEEGGAPLDPWSGLWVATTRETGCAYYAVVATDVDGSPVETVTPEVNATVNPIAANVGPRAPIQRYDSDDRGIYSPQTRVTGTPDLPLVVELHASNATGGGAGEYGDYYNYFGDPSMGYQDGLPSVFAVREDHSGPQVLRMRSRDTIVSPDGTRGVETHWFGYVADPQSGTGRYAYPYTEARLLWTIPWVIARYDVDPDRVYGRGGSMGAWGTMTFSFRHPEIFAALYPNRPRFRQHSLGSIDGPAGDVTLPDGTSWEAHHDTIAFVRTHPGDLPFLGWNVGRHDGFATWQEQLDMVDALREGHHGFAFAWNDGDHSSGVSAGEAIGMWYPQAKFARNLSYPAFANSSIDDDLGSGDPTDGDLEGGINLGFDWTLLDDSVTEWSIDLRNGLAEAEMSVDVTPRRLQAFEIAEGENITYEVTRDGTTLASGELTADGNRLVTLDAVSLLPGVDTRIRLSH